MGLHFTGEVRVDIHRDGHRPMTKLLTDGLHAHTLGQQQRRRGVSKVMEPNVGQTCIPQKRLEVTSSHVPRGAGPSPSIGEHHVQILPGQNSRQLSMAKTVTFTRNL